MVSKSNFNAILGVDKKASVSDIKKARNKLTKQYHSDINKSPEAEEKMKIINEAYAVLSNQYKRQQYDQFVYAGIEGRYYREWEEEWVRKQRDERVKKAQEDADRREREKQKVQQNEEELRIHNAAIQRKITFFVKSALGMFVVWGFVKGLMDVVDGRSTPLIYFYIIVIFIVNIFILWKILLTSKP